MRINKNLEKVLLILSTIVFMGVAFYGFIYGFIFIVNFIWFLQDNNFFGFPIWTFVVIVFFIWGTDNVIKNSLRENKKKLTKENYIDEAGVQLMIAGLFVLVIYFFIKVWSNISLIVLLPLIFCGYKFLWEKNK